jgi:hypothetical protein
MSQEEFYETVQREEEFMNSKNVYALISAVAAELAQDGISKSRKNAQQGYSFRGIDDVYNALAPVVAKHGLVIIPRVLSRLQTERESSKGGVIFSVVVEAEFDFVSSHDGSRHTAKTFGEAMDSADKATNKAMSAAYKYAAFQTFCIPTEGDNDADSTTHHVVKKPMQIPANVGGQDYFDKCDEQERALILDFAMEIEGAETDQATFDAYTKAKQTLDTDQMAALSSKVSSGKRSAIKKIIAAKKMATLLVP